MMHGPIHVKLDTISLVIGLLLIYFTFSNISDHIASDGSISE